MSISCSDTKRIPEELSLSICGSAATDSPKRQAPRQRAGGRAGRADRRSPAPLRGARDRGPLGRGTRATLQLTRGRRGLSTTPLPEEPCKLCTHTSLMCHLRASAETPGKERHRNTSSTPQHKFRVPGFLLHAQVRQLKQFSKPPVHSRAALTLMRRRQGVLPV